MKILIEGQLEIDTERGVMYFHSNEGYTALRISGLPRPIPKPGKLTRMLDIAHMHGCDWDGKTTREKDDEVRDSLERGHGR